MIAHYKVVANVSFSNTPLQHLILQQLRISDSVSFSENERVRFVRLKVLLIPEELQDFIAKCITE